MAKKTVKRINEMLGTLPNPPRIKSAAKEAYCATRGAFPKSAENLAAKLKEIEKTL
jgi:hypothetical protein